MHQIKSVTLEFWYLLRMVHSTFYLSQSRQVIIKQLTCISRRQIATTIWLQLYNCLGRIVFV